MKKICLLLLVVLSLSACKKDALIVDKDKYYMQTNAPKPTDPMFSSAVSLVLKPGGYAGIGPGGDIIYTGTYKITGNRITVKSEMIDEVFKFKIISETEIHGEHGEILELTKY